MDWTYNYMHCYRDYPPLKSNKMRDEDDPFSFAVHLRANYEEFNSPLSQIRASEDPIINKTKNRKMKNKTTTVVAATCEIAKPVVENMKPKKGTAKPSGAGVGKGGPATSPTDGGSLKVKGGKKKK